MITFKQFLAEKAMNRGSYAAAIDRIGHDVKVGFEFEFFMPKGSHFYDELPEGNLDATEISTLRSMGEFENLFSVSRAARQDIENEYAAWADEHETNWIDEHWDEYLDDDEVESDGLRAAEQTAREKAANEYDPAKARWRDWLREKYDDAYAFVEHFELTPRYGWHEEGHSVLDAEPESQGYHENWRDNATRLVEALQRELKTRVVINGRGYEYWNLTHDTTIKDDEGRDSDHEQDGLGYELVSPPEPFSKAMESMAKVFSFIERYGFSTNESTGLHVNISIPDISGRLDPLKLVLFMGDKHTLKLFDRETNTYTSSQIQAAIDGIEVTGVLPKTVPEIRAQAMMALGATAKYYAVNLTKLRSGYLEFRAIGGPGYHKKSAQILDTIGRWVYSIELATEPELEKQEYLKKIAKLLGKTATAKVKDAHAEQSLEQLVSKFNSMIWQQAEAAVGASSDERLRAGRSIAMTLGGQQAEEATFRQRKELISLFKQLGISLQDVYDYTPDAEAKRQVKRFAALFKLAK
jgi:hypothetical protein